MLESLHLKNVGPSKEMKLELGERMNLITGDNGLGKSFLLDVAWWALTRRWPRELNPKLTSGYPARPTDIKKPAKIAFRLESKSRKSVAYESTYVPRDEAWRGKAGRPWNPGLVVYAHADGGFSVWDPARNYWRKKGDIDIQERLPGYVLTPNEVWEGLKLDTDGRSIHVCNGLLVDWAKWIVERGESAARMQEILRRLAPRGEALDVGPLMRLSVNDSRDIPSIRTPYERDVPILHASSGVRRVVGLAYMLMWSWNEHVRAAELLGEERTRQVVMLFDEIESHLHPKWQRTILRSLLHVAESLHEEATVQLIATTHSPLVLASAEPVFDNEKDAWFDLDLKQGEVQLRKREFVRRGEISNWLTSEAFDLREPRSFEAEEAITEALGLLRDPAPKKKEMERVDKLLRRALGDTDRFWLRWSELRNRQARSGRPVE